MAGGAKPEDGAMTAKKPSRGRPRDFSIAEALESAMHVFWRKGYEGASVADLTKAIGINSPSLYAAFGSKRELFHAVVGHYDAQFKTFMENVLAAPCARDVADRLLKGLAVLATDTRQNRPPGSLLVQSGLSCSDSGVPAELAGRRAHWEKMLCERFARAQREGDLPDTVGPATVARHLVAVCIGMCVLAAEGATREELLNIADVTMLSLVWIDQRGMVEAQRRERV